MRFSDYPFLRFLIFFLIGILLGTYIELYPFWNHFAILLGCIWLLYFFLVWKKMGLGLISILGYAQLIVLGISISLFSKSQQEAPNPIEGSYLAEVQRFDLKKPNSKENVLLVKAFQTEEGWKETEHAVLVYHQSELDLQPGQFVWVADPPELLVPPRNPSEFDFRDFLSKKGIFSRQFISKDKIQILGTSKLAGSKFWLVQVRKYFADLIRKNMPQAGSHSIALALLLGQKEQLDRSLRDAFSDAGVMHVLAVSGLHVGILVAVMLFLIKPLKLKSSIRRLYLLVVVLIIWAYAGITGFSPSVVRASVMFSLVVLGEMRDRKPPIFNILAFSAILMIALNPAVIFDVGFQLSYVAVSGIVLIQPLILRFWYPPSRILEYLWQLASVSIAAQLVTFPISVWYFHSFPIWFLPANLLIIPLTFLIMQVGIPFLFLGWIPVFGKALGWVVGSLIQLEVWVLDGFRMLPFRLQEITIYPTTIWVIWGFLLIWVAWEFFPRKRLLYLGVFLLLIWTGGRWYYSYDLHQNQAVIYRSQKGWAVDFWENGTLKSWNQGIQPDEMKFLISPNRIKKEWGNQPKLLTALQESRGSLYFPEIGIRLLNDTLFLPPKDELKWKVWNESSWKSAKEEDVFPLSESAVEISF
ncbi:ComEC family competence protein [Algoriphagus kandeliae]|uniref:ComEC family competence protein n=1 Tax=Algoriphagus kandeliae TaxID=2562278 RepID=A0A4Y9QQZ7_9BACT|nr:ComEC/Rec2 family competence protein [Algoriphagus kandeliae]TFV93325.1 ComEC family competence protein [Algoriphagus kandeliae]